MNQTLLLIVIVIARWVVAAAPARAAAKRFGPATQPVEASGGPHLFIDDYLIAESHGVLKVTQHPQRHRDGPVIGWQEHTTQPYVTVLRDPQSGKFRMWYNGHAGKDCAICYAESDDGEKWTMPKLDIVGPDNRLFIIGRSQEHGSYGVSVIDEAGREKDPQKRYKLIWWSGTSEPSGLSVAWSPDGLRWTQYEKNPVLPFYHTTDPKGGIGVGDIVDLFYDPIRNRYGSLLKLHGVKHDGWSAGPRAGSAYRRLVGQSTSDDFLNWREPWRVMVPEQRDDGQLEFYSSGGTIARGPLLISFIRMLHDDYSPEPGVLDERGVTPGIGYTTLATSRDGENWERHDDVFLDRNPKSGTWDRAMTWVGCALPVGEELYLYYGGYKRGHKIEPQKERQIGLVKMPIDRFVSREPLAGKPGVLLTVPLRGLASAGSGLTLNADANDLPGKIRVQICDARGEPIPGFTFDDCEPITGDGNALPVRWKAPLAQLKDDVRLKFEITDARLFGFDIR